MWAVIEAEECDHAQPPSGQTTSPAASSRPTTRRACAASIITGAVTTQAADNPTLQAHGMKRCLDGP
jgi:hypothetical protein